MTREDGVPDLPHWTLPLPGVVASWWYVVCRLAWHFLRLFGINGTPKISDSYAHCVAFFASWFRWRHTLRIVHAERCPPQGPCVFAGNHLLLSDPFYVFASAYYATRGAIEPRFMMRDDFDRDLPARIRWMNINKLTEHGGAIHINRDNVQFAQMKRFVQTLRGGGSFIMFPGRTRTRSGFFFEYREHFTEIGSASFFLAAMNRERPPVDVAVVPVVRTHNPVARRDTMVFGHPMRLAAAATKDQYREFDHRMAVEMANLVEINLPQLLAAYLYLHALHNGPRKLEKAWLDGEMRALLDSLRHPYIDPAVRADFHEEMARSLQYFDNYGFIGWRLGTLHINRKRILKTPREKHSWLRVHPLRYLANQIIHLREPVSQIEARVLAAL